jgi:outer membrane protein OmpA-like peptidoglycan-associated protein
MKLRTSIISMLAASACVLAGCAGGGGDAAPPASPSKQTPAVSIPSVKVPSVQLPSVQLPTVQLPTVEVPSVEIPTVQLPTVRFPEVTIPEVEVRQGDTLTVYSVEADVLFDFDKSDIRPDADQALRQISESIERRFSDPGLLVTGYTDAKGPDAYNLALSERRAVSVKGWLATEGGLGAARVTTAGRGEQDPVAPNAKPDGSDDPAGRQRNRRVEIRVQTA